MKLSILSILAFLLFADSISALDKSKDCKCRIIPEKKIIGGKIAAKNAYPWQIAITNSRLDLPDSVRKLIPTKEKLDTLLCSGVLLNEEFILTAGHCVPGKGEFNDVSIGIGSNDLVKMFDDKKYAEIEETYPHPKYNFIHNAYDIALIKLRTKVNFTSSIQPACLNLNDVKKYNGVLKMSGWGSTQPAIFDRNGKQISEDAFSRFLKEGDVYDITDSSAACQRENEWGSTRHNICVNYSKKKAIACKGDSGGPLHSIDKSNKSRVIGVTSFGSSFKNETNLIVCYDQTAYTRISAFKDFIEEHIGQNYC